MAAVTIAEPPSPGRTAGCSSRRTPCRPAPAVPLAVRHRRRVVAVGLGILLTIGAARAAVALGGSPLAAPERPSAAPAGDAVRTHLVEPGDTLWSIAVAFAPGNDPRPVVDALAEAHGPGPLVPGETITWQP
jgi:hypothetical protein